MVFQFDHLAMQVDDISEAVDWYLRVIPDTTVLHKDESWAFIDANGTRLAFVKKDQHPGHLAWRVSEEKLEAMAQEYSKPIKTHRDNTRSFYLEAPGGYWIEIICMKGSQWE